MNLSEVNKKFNISYENLYRLSYRTATFMERDLQEFAGFGINQSKIDEFKLLYQEFIDGEQDNELLAIQMFKTEAKDNLEEEVRIFLYDIMLKVRMLSKKDKVTYIQFRNSQISKFKSSELITHARLAIRLINKNIEKFTDLGITPEMLTSYDEKIDSCNEAFMQQKEAIADRDIATQLRINKANEVFELLNKYCYIGKNMWALKNDEARGNDYIITTNNSSSSPPEPDSSEGFSEENEIVEESNPVSV